MTRSPDDPVTRWPDNQFDTRLSPLLSGFPGCFTVNLWTAVTSEAPQVGVMAPDFWLPAANRPGSFQLSHLKQKGPVIVEFLRGTW